MSASPAFIRLLMLISRGYRIDQDSQRDSESVWLRRRGAKIKSVFVYADGVVVAPLGNGEELRVYSDSDHDEFLRFLAQLA